MVMTGASKPLDMLRVKCEGKGVEVYKLVQEEFQPHLG